MSRKKQLDIVSLKNEAKKFALIESTEWVSSIYSITDGKAIGTYFEHKFQDYLNRNYEYERGSSAKGIDFPQILVDMKVTSIKQPQSSCPFKSAHQKIFGLGYSLLVFVYDKSDNNEKQTGNLNILHVIFIDSSRTADFQMTNGIRDILDKNGNLDDLIGFFNDRMLPVDEIAAKHIAEKVLRNPPLIGYLTISNALQWRLQYGRVINEAGEIDGVERLQ